MKTRTGFTIIEILTVIAILAVIAALLFPVFARAKLASKVSVSISQLRQAYLATAMYRADNDGDGVYGESDAMGLPPMPFNTGFVGAYGISEQVLTSPCGCHPDIIQNGPCSDPWDIEVVWGRTYFWADLAPIYRESMPIYWDPNCNDRSIRLLNPYAVKRGNAVLLGGTAITRIGTGELFHPSFYSRPEE